MMITRALPPIDRTRDEMPVFENGQMTDRQDGARTWFCGECGTACEDMGRGLHRCPICARTQ